MALTVTADVLVDEAPIDSYMDGCNDPLEASLRRLRGELARATTEAVQAIQEGAGPLREAVTALQDVMGDVDTLMTLNPNRTIGSTAELADQTGNLHPGAAHQLEVAIRLARQYGTFIVDGILFPDGPDDLYALSRLAGLLGCDILTVRRLVEANSRTFILLTSFMKMTETGTINACGATVSTFSAAEQYIATNKTVAQSAALAGCSEDDVLFRVFWIDARTANSANTDRLRRFGLADDDLQAALFGTTTARTESYVIPIDQPSRIMATGITEAGGCTLLQLVDADHSTVNLAPSLGAIEAAVTDLLNRGPVLDGTGQPSNLQPSALAAQLLDLPKTVGILARPTLPFPPTQDNKGCTSLFYALDSAIDSVKTVMSALRSIMARQILNLNLGIGLSNNSLGLSNCLINFNLGISFGISLVLGFPAKFKLLNVALSAVVTIFLKILDAVNLVLCMAEALVSAIYGGLCGLNPIKPDQCPSDLEVLVQRLRSLLNLSRNCVLALDSILNSNKLSLAKSANLTTDFNLQSLCQSKIVAFAAITFAAIRAAADKEARDKIAAGVVAAAESTQQSLLGQSKQIGRSVTNTFTP